MGGKVTKVPKQKAQSTVDLVFNSNPDDLPKMQTQAYTILMCSYAKHYRKKNKQNRRLKEFFFWITVGMLVLFTCALLIGILIGVKNNIGDLSLISMIVSALTTIIAIPLVIAHYLFNKNEDDVPLSYMEKMKEHEISSSQTFTKEEAKAVVPGKVEISK